MTAEPADPPATTDAETHAHARPATRPRRRSTTSIGDERARPASRSRPRPTGPPGALPLTDEMLRDWPSGDLFGLSQNAGMGWNAAEVDRDPYLILSTQGGLRAPDGTPIALGLPHRALGDRPARPGGGRGAASALGVAPFAGMVSDPCDGRTQGTAGMMDSLPYRNDAAIVFRRLIRSLPEAQGGARRRDLRQGPARDDARPGRGAATCPA